MSKKAPFNVLFLSSWYPNRTHETLGNFVQRHAEAVAIYNNVTTIYVTSDAKLKGQNYEIVEEKIKGVKTIYAYYKKVTSSVPGYSQLLKRRRYYKAFKLAFSMTNKDFDVVHDNILFPSGMIARKLKRKYNWPYIISENWTGYHEPQNKDISNFELMLSRKIAHNADRLCPVSDHLKNSMASLGLEGPTTVIPNVVDVSLFSPSADSTKKMTFVHISTLDDDHKNISGMLRATASLLKKRNDFVFKIVGDGETKPYQQYAEELEIPKENIFFDGAQSITSIAQLMKNSDAFVLFSNKENLPCVIIEALASGLPIISTDVGGVAEHIDENLGVVLAIGDEQALAETMNKMIDNHTAYSQKILVDYATDHFSYDVIGKQFSDLYEELMD